MRRRLLKMSQKDLADVVNYSYQQIQKYEKGVNRVSASVLYEFSNALGVPVTYFFEGLPRDPQEGIAADPGPDSDGLEVDQMTKRDIIKVVRDFDRVKDPVARQKLHEFIKACADSFTGRG